MPHWRQQTKTYRATYPGLSGDVHLDIIIDKLADARSARDSAPQSQKFLLEQFRGAYGSKYGSRPTMWLEWDKLSLTPVPDPSTTATTQPATADERHCCDYDNCAVCDNGNHGYCRRGCTLFSR